jgi:hypothetical protein
VAQSVGAPKDLVGFLDYYFVRKAPFQIPPAGREWLVRFAPWIVIILLIVTVPAVLFVLRLGAWTPFPAGAFQRGEPYAWPYTYAYWPWMLGVVLNFALRAAAVPGLFARRMSGWRLLFYAELIGVAAAFLSMAIVNGLLMGLVAFYILFQIRPLYK